MASVVTCQYWQYWQHCRKSSGSNPMDRIFHKRSTLCHLAARFRDKILGWVCLHMTMITSKWKWKRSLTFIFRSCSFSKKDNFNELLRKVELRIFCFFSWNPEKLKSWQKPRFLVIFKNRAHMTSQMWREWLRCAIKGGLWRHRYWWSGRLRSPSIGWFISSPSLSLSLSHARIHTHTHPHISV